MRSSALTSVPMYGTREHLVMVPKHKLTHRPPNADELRRLVAAARTPSGKIKQYKDPITGNVYSARQVQIARSGGLTPERSATLKRTGYADLVRSARSTSGSNSITYLAQRYAEKHGITVSRAMSDPNFLKAVKMLHESGETERSKGRYSKRSRALVKLGLRSWNDQHRIGQSPKSQRF